MRRSSKTGRVYDQPLYYEIAFSFIDPSRQVDLMLEFAKAFSKVKVRSFLDIGCGPGLQLREVARRGFRAIGLDEDQAMLKYLRTQADEAGLKIETVRADMCDFELEKKGARQDQVDFAFMMMGTISLVESNERFLSHLQSVARCLKTGGLYLIENAEIDWAREDFFRSQSWTMRRGEIEVKTTYETVLLDALTQMQAATIRLDVNDSGKKITFEETRKVKVFFPQEFLALVQLSGCFEFVGWFERDRFELLTEAKEDNIAILRRVQAERP